MKRWLLVLLVSAMTSACAGAETGQRPPQPTSPPTTESPPPSPQPSPQPTASPSPTRQITLELWFSKGGKLFLTKRTATFQPAVARLALTALLRGPTTAERRAGVGSAIPRNTTLRGINVANGVATVDLSREISGTSGEEELRLAVAQIVYTVTQFGTVKAARFEFAGRSIGPRPQTRRIHAPLLPAIVVDSPAIGASVSSPVTVQGTANVFEATVSLRILDSRGREIARTFTTATCGTGCRGRYSKSVRFSVSTEQPGTIEVFEESAENGQPINVVTIPVSLRP
ncbi:MAG TPA: Gmad2 immunoglobulin-like domain-containing protein [Actinomycetota bacterium]|nr:Gmad2 immunoglobulin-like domain-containing protein [Actinomycetota bacterium]